MDVAINYLAVLTAAVVAYGVSTLWHSPMGFGKYWLHLRGLSREDARQMTLTAKKAITLGFFVTLLVSYVLAVFMALTYAFTVSTALELGFWLWLGFLAPTLANGWLWEGKSVKLFAFNAVYALINIEIMAVVLGLWQ